MRWTQTLIPTLKETPADAEITSHKLLLRAGLVRKLTAGLYTFLPIGLEHDDARGVVTPVRDRFLGRLDRLVASVDQRRISTRLTGIRRQPPHVGQPDPAVEGVDGHAVELREG